MKFKTLKRIALAGLTAAVLSACGGGTCATNTNGNLSLKISAPSQYPAGVAVTAYLTMTNTSNSDGNNLVYDVPSTSNYTGVDITINPNGNNQNCTNIAAGKSCTFTASIPAGSHPGSFTVTATPNGAASQSTKTTDSTSKSLQAGSISVTANLGLVSIPTTNNSFYILPNSQTVLPNSNGTATAYVSVYNNSYTGDFSSLNWYDNNGVKLNNITLIGTQQTTQGTVNTYQVDIPVNTAVEQIQFSTGNDSCPLNNDNNTNTSCSGVPAYINVASSSNVGILTIQPNNFNMSESYTSQIVTLSNTGNATISGLTPIESNPLFTETNISCEKTLAVGKSCQLKITYNYSAATANGLETFIVNYNNGVSNVNTAATIPYTVNGSTSSAILSFSPNTISLSSTVPSQTVTLSNTGTAAATLSIPNTLSPLSYTTTCPVAPATLAPSATCTYTLAVNYASQVESSAQTFSVSSANAANPANVAVDWSASPTLASLSASPTSFVLSESMPLQVITLTNNGQATATSLTLPTLTSPLQESATTCTSTLAPSASCTYRVYIAYSPSITTGAESIVFSYKSGNNSNIESVNVASQWGGYVIPEILFSPASATLFSGESVVITATLIGGTNITQNVTITPPIGNNITAGSCTVTSANPSCQITVQTSLITQPSIYNESTNTDSIVNNAANIPLTVNTHYNNATAITLNSAGTIAYITNSGTTGSVATKNKIVQCNVVNGLFSSCKLSESSFSSPAVPALNTGESIMYVSNQGLLSGIASCHVDSITGDLINCVNSRNTTGRYPYGLSITPNNSYAFWIGYNYLAIYACTIDGNGSLSNNCNTSTGVGEGIANMCQPNMITLNSAGSIAYITSQQDSDPNNSCNYDAVTLCNVSGGSLSSCADSGVSGLNSPNGFVFNSSESIAYVANSGSNNILACSVTSGTGALSSCSDSGATGLSYPQGIAINAVNSTAFYAVNNNNSVSICSINTTDGKLSNCVSYY